jgi:enoyl-CoA hydratase/carnithine racemase
MRRRPFGVRREGGRLWLTLDSPGSTVNVFGLDAAAQLLEILGAVPAGVREIGLRSGKAGSFVNGAGLLYARAMRSRKTALDVSAPVRRAYEALAACPLPTVALIEGNCYGCGLELALCCQRRVVRDVPEAHFRMTEIADYRFIPLFGGIERLAKLLGKGPALELLLGGENWSARKAARAGLVELEGVARKSWAWKPGPIPPRRAALWKLAEELVGDALRLPFEVSQRRTLDAYARTVTSEDAKRAMSFFFVRQMARTRAVGTSDRRRPRRAFPGLRPVGSVVEVSTRAEAEYASWVGLDPVRCRGVIDRFRRCWKRLDQAALWAFGFGRARPSKGGSGSVEKLVEEARRCLEDGSLLHPSEADVIVHGLFDFPLEEGSLLMWAERNGLGRFYR